MVICRVAFPIQAFHPMARDALEGEGPQRRRQRRLDRRLEEVAKAVGGGYCRLQMLLKLALGVGETAAGHRLGALEVGGLPMHPCLWPLMGVDPGQTYGGVRVRREVDRATPGHPEPPGPVLQFPHHQRWRAASNSSRSWDWLHVRHCRRRHDRDPKSRSCGQRGNCPGPAPSGQTTQTTF